MKTLCYGKKDIDNVQVLQMYTKLKSQGEVTCSIFYDIIVNVLS